MASGVDSQQDGETERTRHWHPVRWVGRCLARWDWLLAGGGVAALALRASIEAVPPRPWWGGAAAVVCLAGAFLFRTSISWTPLWLCWLYALWPVPAPAVACGLALVAAVAWLARNLEGRRCPMLVIDGLVFLAALALYVGTLAPTILPADSGEFQIVGPLLGVAHPPGYALFTLLAKGFSLLPLGEVAWRVNLMGAVTGALTLVAVGQTARRIGGTPWAGIVAAAALGFSTTFWAQSTTVNIRALTVLLAALSCDCLVRFLLAPAGSREGIRALTGLAVSLGFGISHHGSLAFWLPVCGATILWHDPGLLRRLRTWPRYLLAFLLPFLADLYIVVRAITGAPFGTGELVDAQRVIDHLLGKGFGGDMFAFLVWDRVLWERFRVVGNILAFQFGLPLLVLAILGWIGLAWRKPKVAVLLGGMWATMAFTVATYRAPQSVEYMMPAYVPMALCMGYAVSLVGQTHSIRQANMPGRTRGPAPTGVRALLVAVVLWPVLALGYANLSGYVQLHGDRSARAYAESVLLNAPPGAHILSNWHWYTPLLYLQLVEGQRSDVEVTYLYPQGATAMPQAWAQRIVHELEASNRPLIVTNMYPTYADLPYRFAPAGQAFRVYAGPSRDAPPDLVRVDADLADRSQGDARSLIRFLGYQVVHSSPVRPGDRITVDLAWQPLVPLQRPYSTFVHLVGEDNTPLGQRDQRHDAAVTYEPGEVLVDRYEFPLFLTAAPGTYRLVAGAYWQEGDAWHRLTTGNGGDAVLLATVPVVPSTLPPVTLHPLYRPFADGPVLVGVDYDDTLPAQRRVYLHWQAGDRPAVARLYGGGNVLAQARVPAWTGRGYVTTALDVPPGVTALRVSIESVGGGVALPIRGVWGIVGSGSVALPRSAADPHYLPFGGSIALVGVEASPAWNAGKRERVTLRFLALRSIVDDTVVSVSAEGPGMPLIQSDSVPALGAIPTFKWVRGSQVTDVHLLSVPADARGEIELALGLYDAFTARALPPLDERIARLGRAEVPLRRIDIK